MTKLATMLIYAAKIRFDFNSSLQFRISKKVTKSPSWFDVDLENFKSIGTFRQIFVAFSENLNFTI
jgi:hypothetical protein